VLLLLAVGQFACSPSTVRYRLPLAGNPGAEACYAGCREVRTARGGNAFLECLSACPDIEMTDWERCNLDDENDRPPIARCFTAQDAKSTGSTLKRALVVAALVGAIYGGAVLAAFVFAPRH
jgi:hypothetical protein